MKYNPNAKGTILEAYPELQNFEEFSGSDEKLRFVIILLDEENQEGDIERRVASAAKKAGLRPDGLLEDKEVERMLCRYFIVLNNQTFELWLSKLIAFGEANYQLRSSVTLYKDPIKAMEVKLKVGEGAERLRKDIMNLERALFKDPVVEKKIKQSVEGRTIHYAELFAMENSAE